LVPTEEPIKDGYEFDDWYFDETYLSKFNTNELKSLKVTDVNVFARFLTLYNLSFETNGGEHIGSYLDAKIDTMPACTKSGFTLYAWYFDAGFQNKAEFPLIITEDTTLYAKWAKNEITVNYFLDNESYDVETISYGVAPSLPVPNNKVGHKFSGWKDASGVDFTFNGVLFDNIDLYATFDPKDYVIYYDYSGATSTIVSSSIKYGDKFSNLPLPTKEGYNFNGWYYNDQLIESNVTTYNFDSNITLVAKFSIKQFTIKFYDSLDDEMNGYTYQVPYGTSVQNINFPSVQDVTGYESEWLIDDTNSIVPTLKVKENLSFYLNYSPIKYYIIYDYGNDVTDRKYVYYDDDIVLPVAERYGYVFTGWYYNDVIVNAGTKYNYTNNITLVAKYDLDVFTISFYDIDLNLVDSKEVEYTKNLIDIPNVPSVIGYTGEWCEYEAFEYIRADFTNIQGDMDIYAVYTANKYIATFKVFGQTFDTVEQTFGSEFKLSESIPLVNNYVFVGWYYNDTLVSEDTIYNVDNDIVLNARMVSDILDTPTISYNSTTNILTWGKIDNVCYYNLYSNGDLLSEIEANVTSCNLGSLGLGVYEITLVAMGNDVFGDSEPSNVVTIVNDTTENTLDISSSNIQYNNSVDIGLTFDDDTYILEWEEDVSVQEYVVFVLTNSSFNAYTTNDNSICIYDIVSDTDISAIRLGAMYESNSTIYMSDNLCYNIPYKLNGYTNGVYLFDGYINDYYIQSMDELCNIVYYTYIYRFDEFTFLLDTQFVEELELDYSCEDLDAIDYAIDEAMDSYTETMYYSISYSMGFDGTYYYVTLEYDYYGVYECDISANAYDYYTQDRYDAIYEIYNGTKRSDTYDSYVSDNKYLYTYVNTSEELYWAVENGVTPLFTYETCRPYYIYNKAKEVLNSIIYEEMTDYEKALAIFDWISLNTVYNYTSPYTYQSLGFNGYSDIPSYYLEGVFINGYSVCDGFSKAFSLLCNMEGIEAIRIVGEAGSVGDMGGHAWNKVIIDGECYVVDITWTEIIRSSTTENLTHEYFMVSDEYIAETHIAHPNRSKFALDKYNASNNYKTYYENVMYTYNSNTFDHVITSDSEFKSILDYVIDAS
ncbi:MAG: InlB B-repeat-containing protein, partial [Clostridia bacterium]|nr:InlB B-repeat-containing protein [Clostridia bacterium]